MARPKTSAGDLFFKGGTGLFALVIILIAAGIAFVLWDRSAMSVSKFGLCFWLSDRWDPVSGDFGARPFIWGTLYSSFLALLISTPLALGIAIFLSELCPHRLRQPLVFLTE